ncbi:hypothetical protein [Pseudomonas sp. MF6747]|uniref:hypothetical protein n=1 Tax=Pseudomonas sp. MF6747 TaxID=2797527 RepID=UPI0019090646|nr:hypothetical protein [Pseudomonas sp. MF6747]MBK3510766.1 hypothetical protein [Pseudomonas sp. MF6747]
MSEVMRWKLKGFIPGVEGVSKALFQPWVVQPEDLDRVTAERDAALGREADLQKNFDHLLVTTNYLQADNDSADASAQTLHEVITRLRSERDALQVLLTAADERVDVLEGLLHRWSAEAGGVFCVLKYETDAALKPAEGGGDA